MLKFDPHPDVLVLGEHPAAYLAAALLRAESKLQSPALHHPRRRPADRLVFLNPAFFTLHPLLAPLQRKLETDGRLRLQFLSDDPAVHSEHRSKSALAYIGCTGQCATRSPKLAEAEGGQTVTPKDAIHRLDEGGIDVTVDGGRCGPRC